MLAFIDDHRQTYGVKPIRAMAPIAPSTYYEQKARQADPTRLPTWAQRDAWLKAQIRLVWDDNFQGVWRAQSVAAVDVGEDQGGPVHSRAFDARHGPAGHGPGADVQHHDRR